MHIGQNNINNNYTMFNQQLQVTEQLRDLKWNHHLQRPQVAAANREKLQNRQ